MTDVKWTRPYGAYRNSELIALRFSTEEDIDRAIALIWEDEDLQGVPNDTPDGMTLIVPRDAEAVFRTKDLSFETSELIDTCHMTPKDLEAMAEERRRYWSV